MGHIVTHDCGTLEAGRQRANQVDRFAAPDAKFPARMEVIHVPSGGVQINGVVYVASGPGPHPTFVFFHGVVGIVLYDGEATVAFGDGLFAVPVRALWEMA